MLSWQNILNSEQIATDIEEKYVNQGEVLRGGISRSYLSLSNKWKRCHGAINSRPRNFKSGTGKVLSISLKVKTTTGWSKKQYAKL